jgi:apolipoprotein N-acyltransferase
MADIPNVPLVVDLDGTVIRTDLLWESLARLWRRNPFTIFPVLFWWLFGRAHLKHKLAPRVAVDPATLPYHEPFLDWLRREKAGGRKIILATAANRLQAQPIADHLGLFDEVLGSDDKINLRAEAKRAALVKRFGEHGFDYAGNSRDDLVVWRSARTAVVVNASPRVRSAAAHCARPGPVFCEGYSPLFVARRFALELGWRSGYLAALAAGVLLALAFPKFSIAGFAWVAPGLLLVGARGQSPAGRFRVGYLGGMVFWLISLYWLLLMPVTGLPILGWVALAAFIALYFGVWVVLVERPEPLPNDLPPDPLTGEPAVPEDSWAARTLWALGGAAAWVTMEMVRARLLGGFPWSFLGVSQYQMVPLLQIASVTGVYGVSFLIVWFSLSLYSAGIMILRQPTRRHIWQAEIILPMLVVAGCYVGGFFVDRSVPPESSLRVTAIQPSVPQTLIWSPRDDARRFADLLELSRQALTNSPKRSDVLAWSPKHTDLLLWPESAVPALDQPTYDAINEFVRSNHVWLILNGEDVEFHPAATNYFNSAFLIGPDGRWRQAYHKRQLVIFGEYVPLANWLPFLKWLTPITGGWTPGDQPATFNLPRPVSLPPGTIQITAEPGSSAPPEVHCAPLICFEDTFPGAARASAQDDEDFLVNLTNDGWFGQSAEQWQHLANAVFRAVENGLPLLRCANNGVTGLINEHGRLVSVFHDAHHSEYGPGALTVDIPLLAPGRKPAPTFYNRHGDWFGWACVAVTLLLAAFRARGVFARKP